MLLILVCLIVTSAYSQKKIPKQLRDSTKIKEKEYKLQAKNSIDSAKAIRKHRQDSIAQKNNPDTLAFKKTLRIGIDISKPITSAFSKERFELEFLADYHWSSRRFIAVETGYQHLTIYRPGLYQYTSSGEYLRAGFDYSILRLERAYDNNIIFVGLRAAAANVSYHAQNIAVIEPYFGNSTAVLEPASTRAYWLEFVFGIKIQLVRHISMGWTLRLASQFTDLTTRPTYPLFIPGFGSSLSQQNFTYNYSVYYTF